MRSNAYQDAINSEHGATSDLGSQHPLKGEAKHALAQPYTQPSRTPAQRWPLCLGNRLLGGNLQGCNPPVEALSCTLASH